MKRPRFKLATLLLVTTAVAALLGYSQVRRRTLKREFAELTASGCPAAFQDNWFWPTVPEAMGVTFRMHSDDHFSLASKSLTGDEVFEQSKVLRDKLHALGVDNVWMQTVRN